MVKKSRLNLHEATADVSTATEETAEVSEGEETATTASEMIEDPEEISVTGQRDVSTVERMAISPGTVRNVSVFVNLSEKTKRIQ